MDGVLQRKIWKSRTPKGLAGFWLPKFSEVPLVGLKFIVVCSQSVVVHSQQENLKKSRALPYYYYWRDLVATNSYRAKEREVVVRASTGARTLTIHSDK